MKNNEFLPGTNTWREFSWIFSGILCPAGPLSGNVDKKFTTFYLFFCPLGPLGKFWIKIALLFIWIFAPQGRSAEILVRNMLFFFAPQGRSTGILIRDSLHLFGFFQTACLNFSQPSAARLKTGRFNFPKAGDTRFKSGRGALSLKSRHSMRSCHKTRGVNSSKAGASRLKTGGRL